MSLMCSSIDTVNLKKKKKKRWGEAYLHSFTFTIFCLNSLQTHWLKKYLQIVELYWRAPFCSGLVPVTEQDGSSCPPHTEMEHVATCYMAKETRHWQEPEVRVQYRSLVLGWGRERQTWQTCLLPGNHSESCQGIHLPRECQADGPVSLRQAELLLLSSTEMSFIRTSQINPTSLCFT